MAAPAAVARDIPLGTHLFDGYQTFVGFQLSPRVALWEKSVTPPGVDGGDPVSQDTMWTLIWRQQTPRHLKALTDTTFVAGYDPNDMPTIIGMINIIQSINVYYPDGAVLLFWGFLRKFEVNEHKEGEMPTANCTISPSMIDPTSGIAPGADGWSLRPKSEPPVMGFVSGTSWLDPVPDMRDLRTYTPGAANVVKGDPVFAPPPGGWEAEARREDEGQDRHQHMWQGRRKNPPEEPQESPHD